jgi:hypothetical protein
LLLALLFTLISACSVAAVSFILFCFIAAAWIADVKLGYMLDQPLS